MPDQQGDPVERQPGPDEELQDRDTDGDHRHRDRRQEERHDHRFGREPVTRDGKRRGDRHQNGQDAGEGRDQQAQQGRLADLVDLGDVDIPVHRKGLRREFDELGAVERNQDRQDDGKYENGHRRPAEDGDNALKAAIVKHRPSSPAGRSIHRRTRPRRWRRSGWSRSPIPTENSAARAIARRRPGTSSRSLASRASMA